MTAQTLTAMAVVGVLGLPIGWCLTTLVHLVPSRASPEAPPPQVRYVATAAGTGTFFVLVTWWAFDGPGDVGDGRSPGTIVTLVAFLYLAAVSVVLGLVDIETHTLPNRVVLPSYLIGAILLTSAALGVGEPSRLLGSAIGLVALWALYFLLAMLYPGGMGFGDVKLAGLLGLYLGWLGWGPTLMGGFSAFVLGGLFALMLLVAKRVSRAGTIPFGPWMLAGAWTGILTGGFLWDAYLGILRFT